MYLTLVFCNVLFLLLKSQESSSANILAVSSLPSGSHYRWNKFYLMELVGKGHNVTILSTEEETEKHGNFTVIIMEGILEHLYKQGMLEKFMFGNTFQNFLYLFHFEELICEYALTTNGLRTLLDYPPDYKFDLIIWDLNCGRCLYPLIDRFGTPPVIGTSPFGNPPHMNYAFGGSTSAVVPSYHVSSSDGLNFITRLKSYIYNYLNIIVRYLHANPREFKLAQDFFGKNIKTIDEVERNISLVLSSVDPVLMYSEPLPPNVIPVGGLHIPPVKKLPQDLQSLLDNSRDGIIVVAFGGNVNLFQFGEQQQQAIIGAFHKLKFNILFKSPKLDFELPDNVFVREWLPLNDILAHSNTKLLITHGGSLTTYEALYHGVPIIGIPLFVDQFGNMIKIHSMKRGRYLNYADLTPDLIFSTVMEIFNNPIFHKNTKLASEIYRHQPQSPMERALFWTEYVLKFGNADHLNIPARDFNFLQNHNLDVLATICAVLALLLCLVFIVLRKLSRCFSSASKQKQH